MSTILWRERNLLELLLFKLEEERLVLAAGLSRWLPRAAREVELVLGELQRIEEPKAGALGAVAAELGLDPRPTLQQLAAAAPPPWDGLLEQHHAAVVDTAREIGPLERVHRGILGSAQVDAAVVWLERLDDEARERAHAEPGGAAEPAARLRLLPNQG